MNTPSTPVFLRPLALPDVEIYAFWGLDRRFCEHAGWTVDKHLPAREAHWRSLITDPKPGLEHGFNHLGLDEIRAEAMDANHASVRILTSLAMTETGKGTEEAFLGTTSFYRQFSVTKAEWDRRTAS